MKFYENPNCKPLEKLKLSIKNEGVITEIDALNAKWADKRYILHYELPEIYNNDGSEIMGAKEHWLEIIGYIINDLNWLLGLPFYRFWSNVIYNNSIIDMLVSFLQEAPPFYALENFPAIPEMLEMLEQLRHNILIVFVRLVTMKESSTEYMSNSFLGNLLYNNYIFTIPIIFDLCQLYGRENNKVVKKIIHDIFSLQPLYNDDLQKSIPCLIQALRNVEQKFEDGSVDEARAMVLTDKNSSSTEITLYNLEDFILYILDVSSTLTILLKSYSPLISTFHREDLINKIVSIYGNTIPEMYKKLDRLAYNDESMPKYMELKHRLDVTRVEILDLYRIIIYEPILNIQKNINIITESKIRSCIDEYLNLLMNAISEKEFIMDYHQFYPINLDLDTISTFGSEIDTIKYEYILNALYASIGDIKIPADVCPNNVTKTDPGPSGVQNNRQKEHNDINSVNNEIKSSSKNSDKLTSLISEVKEILCDYGEGFIQLCLKHYNHNVESVINAVLEDNLPVNLRELDKTLPYIPPDPTELPSTSDLAFDIQKLNVLDNDEFDLMMQDEDTSRMHIGKKKEKYKDINEMLNDKSVIKETKNIYEKYSIVADNVDDYSDEYDDTYDSHITRHNALDDSTEIDTKPFTIPRILRVNDKCDAVSEDDSETEEKSVPNRDHFIQNPAELRAKAEQRRQLTRNDNAHNTIGKSRGQEQNKNVLVNRHKKNIYKASQSNHNRRVNSQIKKRQGMIPS